MLCICDSDISLYVNDIAHNGIWYCLGFLFPCDEEYQKVMKLVYFENSFYFIL